MSEKPTHEEVANVIEQPCCDFWELGGKTHRPECYQAWELAALRKDKARLDWLDHRCPASWSAWKYHEIMTAGKSWREAIDAAMEAGDE